jgi:GTP-binding protein Era
VDGSEKAGTGDKWIVDNLLKTDKPVIMVINKVDQIKNISERDNNIVSYKSLFEERSMSTVKISAKTGRNIDTLIKHLAIGYKENRITVNDAKAILSCFIDSDLHLMFAAYTLSKPL